MLRRLLRSFVPLVLALALGTSAVQAQVQAPQAETEKSERSVSAAPYAVLVLYSLLVLLIVCMPSRKA